MTYNPLAKEKRKDINPIGRKDIRRDIWREDYMNHKAFIDRHILGNRRFHGKADHQFDSD